MTAPPQHFVNRELSLLDFQTRVLGLAERTDLPLLERLKFVAIVTQNLDEFFQVRVAGLMNQVDSGVGTASPDGLTATQQLAAIDERVTELFSRIDTLFSKELLPLLDEAGIHLIGYDELEADEIAELQDRFEQQIFPVLTPLAVDPAHPFPYISNLSLNLAVVVRDPDTDQAQFARLKVPPLIPRFSQVGSNRFVPVEQVIAANCHLLFPGHSVVDTFAFRVTRTAELAVEEAEADDLLQAIDSLLRFRQRTAGAIRLEVEEGSREPTVELLRRELQLDPAEVYHRAALLDLGALWSLYDLDRPDLKESPWVPTTSVRLRPAGEEKVRMFDVIRSGDVLVHYPYESFATSTGAFLAQAAKDPKVLAIKQTLYRTWASENPAIGGEEAVVRSLMQAAEAGKQVVVLVELTARFDEAANLNWAKMLEDSGVHVVYGVVGLKTHSKILLVVRRERDGLRRYSHIGTGNYNPKTARIYEDIGIFTADPDIGRDLSELFNALTGYGESSAYRRLLVAPTTLRRRITERIRQEGERGTRRQDPVQDQPHRRPGHHRGVVRGVAAGLPDRPHRPGDLLVARRHTRPVPDHPVRSIVGRFLEHSRIYRFGHPDDGAVYYLGSADMMTRNLDKRVEALVPVTDPRLKARLEENLAGVAGGRRPGLVAVRRDLVQAPQHHRVRHSRRHATARPRPPGTRERRADVDPAAGTTPLGGCRRLSTGAEGHQDPPRPPPEVRRLVAPQGPSRGRGELRGRRRARAGRGGGGHRRDRCVGGDHRLPGAPTSQGGALLVGRSRVHAVPPELRGRRGGLGVPEGGNEGQLLRRRPVGDHHGGQPAEGAAVCPDPPAAPHRSGDPRHLVGRRRAAPAVGAGAAPGPGGQQAAGPDDAAPTSSRRPSGDASRP